MNLKDYFIAGGLAIGVALIVTFVLWLFSLIGWWVIGGLITFLLVPVMMNAIEFYRNTNCSDLSDLWIEVEDYFKEKNKKSKESKTSEIDW